jgi:hypothetical protein
VSDTHHTCPRSGCTRQVPDHMFACRNDWYALSKPVRDAIWATSGKGFTRERIDAIKAAREDWGDTP